MAKSSTFKVIIDLIQSLKIGKKLFHAEETRNESLDHVNQFIIQE